MDRAQRPGMKSGEEWRAIPGAPGYEVSSEGRVRSWRTTHGLVAARPTLLRPGPDRSGRLRVTICPRRGKSRKFFVHTLVAEAFLGPRPTPDAHVAHGNGDELDNRAVNLRWASSEENQRDKYLHGTMHRGEALDELTVDRIRTALEKGQSPYKGIAEEFKVDENTVGRIARGEAHAVDDVRSVARFVGFIRRQDSTSAQEWLSQALRDIAREHPDEELAREIFDAAKAIAPKAVPF